MLDFNVKIYCNPTAAHMTAIVEAEAKANHADADTFAMVLLSHGDDGGLFYGTDGAVYLENLIKPFRGDCCPDLAGKPKLFFIQACRGSKLDSGTVVETDGFYSEDERGHLGSLRRIPVEADLLVAYAVQPGYFAFRNSLYGSWFIQALTNCLQRYGRSLDLMSILTRVNHEVAYEFESMASNPEYSVKALIKMTSSPNCDKTARWVAIECILGRKGPMQRSEFEPSTELVQMIARDVRVLVVGAGGLGCELLKSLFLFSMRDIGRPKAEVAAEFIMKRVETCTVTPHFKKLEDFDESFYRQFDIVVCGLDSVIARRWINSMLASLVRYNDDGTPDPYSIIPLVDGGTEGFKGHIIVVLFGITGCVECSLDLYPPQVNYPLCTIAHTPRLPEHCVEYVRLLLWPEQKPFGAGVAIDADNPEHLTWVYERCLERAKQFGIEGVTVRLVKGVIKRIIPAVASTNAVIAAALATEVFKIVTLCYDYLKNYMNFSDLEGIYTYTFAVERKPDCIVCNNVPKNITFAPTDTLGDVIEYLKTNSELQMHSPSITTVVDGSNRSLYLDFADAAKTLRPNLKKQLSELGLTDGQMLMVSDVTTPRALSFRLCLSKSGAAC